MPEERKEIGKREIEAAYDLLGKKPEELSLEDIGRLDTWRFKEEKGIELDSNELKKVQRELSLDFKLLRMAHRDILNVRRPSQLTDELIEKLNTAKFLQKGEHVGEHRLERIKNALRRKKEKAGDGREREPAVEHAKRIIGKPLEEITEKDIEELSKMDFELAGVENVKKSTAPNAKQSLRTRLKRLREAYEILGIEDPSELTPQKIDELSSKDFLKVSRQTQPWVLNDVKAALKRQMEKAKRG